MITPQPVYYPLYTDKEKFIILITGGRGSGKSFNASAFIERLTFELTKTSPTEKLVHQILYTRYTMTSAHMSIIPEFMEKVELDGTTKYFHTTKTDVVNKMTGSCIMFRGIKTSSGNQTAKLKSIHGITTFVCDEGEEWTDETDFDKIMLSIRQKGIQNRIVIIMNPTDSNHFIYKKYIENTHDIVEIDGVQVQISTHPSVLHIHTTYLDNMANLSPQFLKEVEDMKVNNPEKYGTVVIGRWADVSEGAVFKKWGIVDEFPEWAKKVAIGLDFGYSVDCTAIVRCGIVDNSIYIDELDYRTGLLSTDIIQSLRKWNMKTIADSADPRLIQEIHNGGIKIYPVEKGAGSINAGIDKMQSMEIFVTKRSYNLQNELRGYVWDKDKNGMYTNTPIDANNHCFRGDTLVTTINGDIPIKDIVEGDYVLTRKGYKKVLKKHCNGIKKVVEKELVIGFEKRTFFATLEHKFNVNGRWKKYEQLTKMDRLYVLSNSTDGHINDTLTGNTPTIITANGKKEIGTSKSYCIMQYMRTLLEKFPKGKSYIISTTIRLTMMYPILWLLRLVNMVNYTSKRLKTSRLKDLIQGGLFQKEIGNSEEKKRLLDCNLLQGLAYNVVMNISPQMCTNGSAQSDAISCGKQRQNAITLNLCANSAEGSLLETNTSNQELARKNAVLSWQDLTDVIIRGESYCEVYDLTIEDEHEFFANGVLVHNCIDAVRYYILGEILGRIQKPKSITGVFH